MAFPRFYFLGDDDLLEILGQSTNPAVIQSHLKKLFQGIHMVQFDGSEKNIVAMVSIDGEVVPLKRSIKVIPEVEVCTFLLYYFQYTLYYCMMCLDMVTRSCN